MIVLLVTNQIDISDRRDVVSEREVRDWAACRHKKTQVNDIQA